MFKRFTVLAYFQFICLILGRHLPRNKPIIVCYVQLNSELNDPLRTQLSKCSYIIVCDVTCDRSDPLLPYRGTDSGDKFSRLKDSAKHATFMLSTVVNPFELQDDEGSDRFCREMELCLNGDLYDGIDLDVDPTMLDVADQINYARFLRKMRRQFNTSVSISTTIAAQRIEPVAMVDALIETLSFVILAKDDTPSIDVHGDEFVLRKYPHSVIDNMLNVGFPSKKIVLGLKTAGVVTNPSYEREQYSKKCSKIGLIPYGQVCELRDQSKRFCSWRYDRRCLIFDGQSKVVYDSAETARERAEQCSKRNLKGVSLLLNQDDDAGICEENNFPLLNAIEAVFDKYDDEECGEVGKVEDDKKRVEENRLTNELKRLEKAVENIEKFSGILEKIVNFMFRTMDKLIDLVISFTGKYNKNNRKKVDTELENVDNGSVDNIDGLEDIVEPEGLENFDPNIESVRHEEIESMKDDLPMNVEDNFGIPQNEMIQHQMDGNKDVPGVIDKIDLT